MATVPSEGTERMFQKEALSVLLLRHKSGSEGGPLPTSSPSVRPAPGHLDVRQPWPLVGSALVTTTLGRLWPPPPPRIRRPSRRSGEMERDLPLSFTTSSLGITGG